MGLAEVIAGLRASIVAVTPSTYTEAPFIEHPPESLEAMESVAPLHLRRFAVLPIGAVRGLRVTQLAGIGTPEQTLELQVTYPARMLRTLADVASTMALDLDAIVTAIRPASAWASYADGLYVEDQNIQRIDIPGESGEIVAYILSIPITAQWGQS